MTCFPPALGTAEAEDKGLEGHTPKVTQQGARLRPSSRPRSHPVPFLPAALPDTLILWAFVRVRTRAPSSPRAGVSGRWPGQ